MPTAKAEVAASDAGAMAGKGLSDTEGGRGPSGGRTGVVKVGGAVPEGTGLAAIAGATAAGAQRENSSRA